MAVDPSGPVQSGSCSAPRSLAIRPAGDAFLGALYGAEAPYGMDAVWVLYLQGGPGLETTAAAMPFVGAVRCGVNITLGWRFVYFSSYLRIGWRFGNPL